MGTTSSWPAVAFRVSTDDVESTMIVVGWLEKGQPAVLLQRARHEARLGEHLETVADAKHRSTFGRVARDRLHHGRKTGQRSWSQVVPVGESAGKDDAVERRQVTLGMPDELRIGAELRDRRGRVVLTVGPREDDDANPGHDLGPLRDSCVRVLDDGIREEPFGEGRGLLESGTFVRCFDVETEGLARVDVAHAGETQSGQGALDGRTLRVGDAFSKGHVDDYEVVHAYAPYQSVNDRPVTRSYAST